MFKLFSAAAALATLLTACAPVYAATQSSTQQGTTNVTSQVSSSPNFGFLPEPDDD
ncbi:hypothetical protein NZD89_27295 [Alicyclobacillus fastidiosus]|uniref:Lipoprotein n=1 Tax=Alicyclobacillus fastidiosus TaxID=392011 RepID=A0ABY6ZG96_9BACL|nr:hypothetical protein [Alicyclobacillus fastidiosus]WAH41862.1 hypothetical protein NZD89_27295 [Alicyclobacillus fastidiosus]GMA63568.1 hypothetical protein GCM10025859_40080 [Alicyclobacillus fastidiosus]